MESKMKHLILALAFFLCGCGAGLMPALSAIGQGAQWLSSALAVADAGQNAYFDRHPSLESENAVKVALLRARLAVEALDAAVAAAGGANDGNVKLTKEEALDAYEALRELLESLGVTSALPPLGGAETNAPVPQPFSLPTRAEIAARL